MEEKASEKDKEVWEKPDILNYGEIESLTKGVSKHPRWCHRHRRYDYCNNGGGISSP